MERKYIIWGDCHRLWSGHWSKQVIHIPICFFRFQTRDISKTTKTCQSLNIFTLNLNIMSWIQIHQMWCLVGCCRCFRSTIPCITSFQPGLSDFTRFKRQLLKALVWDINRDQVSIAIATSWNIHLLHNHPSCICALNMLSNNLKRNLVVRHVSNIIYVVVTSRRCPQYSRLHWRSGSIGGSGVLCSCRGWQWRNMFVLRMSMLLQVAKSIVERYSGVQFWRGKLRWNSSSTLH